MKELKRTGIILTLIIAICLMLPLVSMAEEIRRLDEDGYLYYMDYTEDYYSSQVMDALKKAGFIDAGCSTFFTYNLNGEPISCRNYDFPHRMSSEDPTLTGLNMVVHCKPEGKYESIAIADAIYCDPENPTLRPGGPDKEDFDISLLQTLPYECMDGINEKGLFVSIMKLDIKKGEQQGRFNVSASMLARYMLDDCANVEEAIAKVDTAIVKPEDWQGFHLFVTDAEGRHVLIESRNSVVSLVEIDVVTNFYLASNDLEDYYKNGTLREEAINMVDENGDPLYQFGYGHGYHRFVTIASQLERYRKDGRTMMPESSALVILQSAVQNPYTESTGTSMTQYSVIYNNAERKLSVWPFQNYEKEYQFDITGKQLQ